MSFVTLGGPGMDWPQQLNYSPGGALQNTVIDATGERVAFIGRVWFPERTGSKSIRRVQFRFNAVTKAGGSGLTISLQDVSLASGPPIQPDGVADQTVAVANGNASFAANTWLRSDAFSADRVVQYGELLAVVVEYDASGRLGTDSVTFSLPPAAVQSSAASVSLFTGTWATSGTATPSVVLEFSDGTYGTFHEAMPFSSSATYVYNSGTAGADEYALRFQVPFTCKVDALWASVICAADFDLVLYQGTTPLQTVSVDANSGTSSSAVRLVEVPIPETTLSPATVYYVAVKPTTTTSITLPYLIVNDNAFLSLLGADTTCYQASRLDGGAWTENNTRRSPLGVRISAIDDGAGSSSSTVRPRLMGRLLVA